MSYFSEVYLKLYDLLTFFWWPIWCVLLIVFVFSLAPVHIEKWKYKGQFTYCGIIFFTITLILGLLFWIFLPSPKYLGLI